MKLSVPTLLAAAIAATLISTVAAMPTGEGAGLRPWAQPMDCSKAKDKARCESLNKDIEACKDKTGDDWRACMHQAAPSAKFSPPKKRDCAKASNQERCEAHNSALEACKDKSSRAEHRKCMAGQ